MYLVLQIPLTKCTRDTVFINTSLPENHAFLLKPKSVLDELPPNSTEIESDNVIYYSKRPRLLQNWCLADYVSEPDAVYPKEDSLPESTTNEDDLKFNVEKMKTNFHIQILFLLEKMV